MAPAVLGRGDTWPASALADEREVSMDIISQPVRTLKFDGFWRWLQEHTHCILRCGSVDAMLYDHDDFHWALLEEERQHIVQVLKGKVLVGELVIPGREVTEVNIAPDPDTGAQGHFLVELMGGPKEDPQALYHFIMAHGIDPAPGHKDLKH
ncbi:serine/threonine kinase associate protein KapA [Myxococcus xanthus DK 1622]|uniref:Serine/threonine kinase associate protein KapA n=3 Tax=Myxococcaceae TaxID=31 RepID=Q1CWC9_MYXXD|nr:serine/threonine kinase associate protein KapA [Myxococcus xanthus DZF1]ABF93076.1 serine/threonine kinase associate protein KapA [Myxococcus xanthus DK 1622]NOJ51636.1 serine/threonine protein kinase [Myxococcus xanthus]